MAGSQDAAPLKTVTPHANDVLLGKGNVINSHPGNRQFRLLVDSQRQTFSETSQKKVKRAIAVRIASEIERLEPPGRFLVEDHIRNRTEINNGSDDPDSNIHPSIAKKVWIVAEPAKALTKIMHRLRERGNEDSEVIPDQISKECGAGDITSAVDQVKHHSASNTEVGNSDMLHVQDVDGGPSLERVDLQVQPDSCSSDQLLFNDSSTNRDDTSIAGNLDSDSLSEYLKGFGLDFELDSESTPQIDHPPSHHLREYTLRQWVMLSKPDISFSATASLQSSVEVKKYMKSALLIALKLTECILEAEKDELNGHENPIPIESMAPENVLIRARVESGTGHLDESEEIIEFVWVMSFVGDNSATGEVMARLFAMGKVLYELFSTRELKMKDSTPSMISMSSMNLSNDARSVHRTQKKTHWRSVHSDDEVSNCVVSLASAGVPWSLCALVKNLLECKHVSFCEDDAYASFADLKADLQLMLDNPSCFLDNIQVSTVPRLEFPDKLFGRDDELLRLGESYKRHLSEKIISGAIISGRAGVGKTKLAMHMQKLTMQSNGYFLTAKFERNQSLKPLATISNLLGSLCETIFNGSSQSELKVIEDELTSAIGSHSILLEVVPNLKKLMPASVVCGDSAYSCVDSVLSMKYILGELMRVISSHSKPITLFIDDIQFADDASLQLVGNLILSAKRASTFFIICHRDDEVSIGGSFSSWLASASMFSLESIQLESITPEGVNNLIAETLHLSHRITRRLSYALHCKTRGNPLFLRQLLDSLTEQGFIYIDMNQHRWAWDLDKIMKLKISDSVVALLTKEIERLPSDLQYGLLVASCIGLCLAGPILCCLSKDLGYDLTDILRQVSQKGFMIEMAGSTMFCFAHDKIQEAVYGLMSEEQRRDNHMRFGLALCNHTLKNNAEDEELFFAAINQINLGGSGSVHDPSLNNVIAELNLKAGRRSIDLSDYNTAFKLFQHGISFLGDEKWTLQYQLSVALYDAVSGAAFVLNNLAAVRLYTDEVVTHARCFDDKLNCLCTATKAIASHRPDEAMDASFGILLQFGELPPRTMEEHELRSGIKNMIYILQTMSDDMICNMCENKDSRLRTLLNFYEWLSHYLLYFKPWLLGSVSLRMLEITLKAGLSPKSPLAFANFGAVLMSIGDVSGGCRLGKLALKLVEKKGSYQYKSSVISIVYDSIFWAIEPLHSIVEVQLLGYKAGQQSGDVTIALKNLILSILNNYAAGQSLDTVEKSILDFISKIHGLEIFLASPVLLLSQITILREGLDAVQADNLPSENEILADPRAGAIISLAGKIYHLTRAFLFHEAENVVLKNIDISGAVAEHYHQVTPDILIGNFFEGLAYFQLARQSDCKESAKWIERGLSALTKMRGWSEHSLWNWENKMLLLEAESLYTQNISSARAESFYDDAIRSAHAHKFIHEEAIASELAGTFYHERGFHQKSYLYFVHSVQSYNKWGARAVAKRVQSDMICKFGSYIDQPVSSADESLDYLFATSPDSNKRQQFRS